jgi:hypothetical protein
MMRAPRSDSQDSKERGEPQEPQGTAVSCFPYEYATPHFARLEGRLVGRLAGRLEAVGRSNATGRVLKALGERESSDGKLKHPDIFRPLPPLPKAYTHAHSLARSLDDAVKFGVLPNADLIKVQATVALIFEQDGEETQNDKNGNNNDKKEKDTVSSSPPKKKKKGKEDATRTLLSVPF